MKREKDSTSAKIKPLAPYIYIREEIKNETESGFILTEIDKSQPKEGVVVAVYPGCKELKGGERVLWGAFNGDEVADGFIVKMDDILAILK